MKVKSTVVCLPVRDLQATLIFYQEALGFSEATIDEGIIVLELSGLTLFMMATEVFESYTTKANRSAIFSDTQVATIISCAMESKNEVDNILNRVSLYGGRAADQGGEEVSHGYTAYVFDPDGHLWELVYAFLPA